MQHGTEGVDRGGLGHALATRTADGHRPSALSQPPAFPVAGSVGAGLLPAGRAVSLRGSDLTLPSLAGAHSLTTATWVTMIVIGAFVWGGFALVLSKAVRTESEKSEAERA